MKSIIRILSVICLFLIATPAKSQSSLSVDTIFGWPDTVISGQTIPINIVVRNSGPTPYSGTLQVAFQSQTPVMGTIGYLYFNNAQVFINSGDTITLSPGNGFGFDSTYFKMGNNVVVVWPVASSSVSLIDTATYTVWVTSITGIPRAEIPEPALYPIPAKDHLIVKPSGGSYIERVRIFNLEGREIQTRHSSDQSGGFIIFLEGLPSGIYILESFFADDVPVHSRFIHVVN